MHLIIPSFLTYPQDIYINIWLLGFIGYLGSQKPILKNPVILIINRLMHIIHRLINQDYRPGCALIFRGAKSRFI
jgi:hypothetical protein